MKQTSLFKCIIEFIEDRGETYRVLIFVHTLIAGLGLISVGQVAAQTLTTLHNFTALTPNPYRTNSDGAHPFPIGGLVLSGNTIYGTAEAGGSSGQGTVFAVNIDGAGFTTLHSFTARYVSDVSSGSTNTDGSIPESGLILSGSFLYGTASEGGRWGGGTIFSVNTNGTGFTVLHSFTDEVKGTNYDGYGPIGSLVLSNNTLYGTTSGGGSNVAGTVFTLNTDGTGFTTLYNFTRGFPTNRVLVNSDGAIPGTGLILSSNTLYGTTTEGGNSGSGTLFSLNTDGTGFSVLHSFTALSGYLSSNSDGGPPFGRLVVSGNILYGTAESGGTFGMGTVFAVNTDGTGFTNLHNFTSNGYTIYGYTTNNPYGTNSDGAQPYGGLVLFS